MQIRMATVMVDDQDKALGFYTNVLGFVKKDDILMGNFRWLTVSSSDGLPDAELVLERTDFPPSRAYQHERFEAGIPAAAFITTDIESEYTRLLSRGVQFRGAPQVMGVIKTAVFEDTCGNIINLVERL